MLESAEAQFAVAVVREAALLARRIQRDMVTEAITKDDRSPVTVADFAVQALVSRRLSERFPGAKLVGEEQADALRKPEAKTTLEQIAMFVQSAISDATPTDVCNWIDHGSGDAGHEFWTLDPIDGTKGFLRREQYAVAFALVRDGRVQLGVLGCPELHGGTLHAAARGQGTWQQPLAGGTWQQVSVSPRSKGSEARILRSVEKSHTNVDEISQLAAKLGTTEAPIGMDSQAKYAVLASGGGDVMLRLLSPSRPDYREKIWDQAAGSIVTEEAGGRITDLDGKPLDFSHGRTLAQNRGIVTSNGHLHAAVLETLRTIGA